MASQVWKYAVQTTVAQDIEIPEGGEILYSAIDENTNIFSLWVKVNPENNLVRRTFKTHGTGWAIEDESIYVGTYQQGGLVWHVFEDVL